MAETLAERADPQNSDAGQAGRIALDAAVLPAAQDFNTWLADLVGGLPTRVGKKVLSPRASRYFNTTRVLAAVKDDLSAKPGSIPDALVRARVLAVVESELFRAEWQASRTCTVLGAELLAVPLLLVSIAWLVVTQIAFLPGVTAYPIAVLAWAGAMGGASMAIYGFTHSFLYNDIRPSFWWWDVSRPVFGAVSGTIVAAERYLQVNWKKQEDYAELVARIWLL